jgi:hypothetical protein
LEESRHKAEPEPDERLSKVIGFEAVRVLREVWPETDKPEEKTPAELTLNDCPIPTLPVTDKEEPIPTNPSKNVVPVLCRLYCGAEVPIPNLKLDESQKKLATELDNELESAKKATAPVAPVPSIDDPAAQVTKLFEPSRQTADPDPDPNAVSLTAEDEVKVPPIPTFPEAFRVVRLVFPATLRDEDREVPEVTVKEPPTAVFPDVFNVVRLVFPPTFNDEDKDVPDATVND